MSLIHIFWSKSKFALPLNNSSTSLMSARNQHRNSSEKKKKTYTQHCNQIKQSTAYYSSCNNKKTYSSGIVRLAPQTVKHHSRAGLQFSELHGKFDINGTVFKDKILQMNNF